MNQHNIMQVITHQHICILIHNFSDGEFQDTHLISRQYFHGLGLEGYCLGLDDRVTTLQTMWNSPTFPWRFTTLLRCTRHVKCYSYYARTSTKQQYGHKYAAYNKQL